MPISAISFTARKIPVKKHVTCTLCEEKRIKSDIRRLENELLYASDRDVDIIQNMLAGLYSKLPK
jgi:hypothetical protein